MTNCARPFQDCTSLCDHCAKPDRLSEINARTRREMTRIAIQSIAIAAAATIVIFSAGYWGLSRAERAYQIERV